MEKKLYEELEVEVLIFETDDVIKTSPEQEDNEGEF